MIESEKMPTSVKVISNIRCWCINQYNDSRIKVSILTTVVFGIFSYLYFITNNLHSQDNPLNMPSGVGSTLSIGRWFLWVIDGVSERLVGDSYNIPVFLVTIAILSIALSSCLIVKMLRIKSLPAVVSLSAIMVVFPAVVSHVMYSFTAIYLIGVLFAVLGVYLTYRLRWFGLIPTTILFACSLGTYQAYIPLAVSLYIILLIIMCFDKDVKAKDIIINGIIYVVSLIGGFVVYLLGLNFILDLTGSTLSSYQGANSMGAIDISLIPSQIIEIYSQFLLIPFIDVNNLSITLVMKLVYLVVYITTAVLLLIKVINLVKQRAEILKLLLLAALLVLFPIAINFIVIMVPYGDIHNLMQLPFVAIFYLCIVLVEGTEFDIKRLGYSLFNRKTLSLVISIVIAIGAINYSYAANGSFLKLHYSNTQIEHYYSSLFNRIQSAEGYYEDIPIYILGDQFNGVLINPWETVPFTYTGSNTDKSIYSKKQYILLELGLTYMPIDRTHPDYILHATEVDSMPTYPSDGSVLVIDEKLFVKMVE